ncbi:MAG: MFS transporter [Candidatus Bathyarchaeota archaeon]
MWSRSLKILVVETVIFGLCSAAFEILFSLYLDSLHVSLSVMGIIFSISGLVSFLVTIILGAESDVRGRKLFYSASLLLGSVTSFFVPFLKGMWELTFTRISKDITLRIRQGIHPTFVFEHVRLGYAKIIATVHGLELTSNGLGTFLAGSMVLYLGFQNSFFMLGLLFIGAFVVFQMVKEPNRPKGERKSFREMYRFDISTQLKIISVYNLIFGIGLSICHTAFIFTLFFVRKFAVDSVTLSIILSLHNFTFGLPLLIMSKLFARPNLDLKKALMAGNLIMGLSHIITAFIPVLIPAAAIWYIHDIFGAAIFQPAQRTLIQQYSRDKSRGKDVNITNAFTSIGMFIGPVTGGYLAQIDINLPFIIGGAVIALATLSLLPLNRTTLSNSNK